jgi:hypothetical protein
MTRLPQLGQNGSPSVTGAWHDGQATIAERAPVAPAGGIVMASNDRTCAG